VVETTVEADRVDRPAAPPPAKGPRGLLLGGIGVAVAAVLAVVLFVGVGTNGGEPDVAPGITPVSAYLLQLDVYGQAGASAPNFTLTDQFGRTVSLAQFRGKSVVLTFNDDRCLDICTLLAQDIVVADRDLGSAAKDVVFLSVNANPYYPDVGYVRSWSEQHGLGHTSNWVFATGTPADLTHVWGLYGVEVELDPATRSVVHSTEMYFIGPTGRQQAIGSFGTASADTPTFAHVMAQMANDVLPRVDQVTVAGPSAQLPDQSPAAIGATVPGFSLPLVNRPTRTLDLAGLRGRFTVLNFWSSTCTACVREMPNLEQAYKDLGQKVNFVGVDVSDDRSAAARFAQRTQVTYPLVSDRSGSVAATYQIPALPFTAVLSPRDVLKSLHPGALTTEQLEYVVENLDPRLMRS
jgi:cytochrome oxidase Cu insertion factor (SCO1/SenC/PrrC family)